VAEHSNEASAASVTFSEFELQTPSTPSEDSALEEASEKKEEKVIERPQILAERNAKKVSALSIKSIQKKNQMKQELVANKPDAENLPFNDFTLDEMLAAWQSYSAIIENEGKYNLHSHLSMGVPKLEGSVIHLEFPNNTIKLEVERARHELLDFLREKLQNYDVSLSIDVNETSAKRYAYTDREKFEKLKEINPLMDKLRKEFDLDV
jgi:DNA polymerase-3 subunit gamma/tau